ncbi:hypothetical protein FG93_04813 [Bosea sp. LC85]|nr:hypothetical protein [Bosea sp. LC85]KFC65272.1 hypothetical protein FG93_04813 [Bosea sp. LC85]
MTGMSEIGLKATEGERESTGRPAAPASPHCATLAAALGLA